MGKSKYPNQQKISDEKFDFIEQWLPARYTTSVNILLRKDPKDAVYIRKVRNRKIKDDNVLDALYKISIFNKIQTEKQFC